MTQVDASTRSAATSGRDERRRPVPVGLLAALVVAFAAGGLAFMIGSGPEQRWSPSPRDWSRAFERLHHATRAWGNVEINRHLCEAWRLRQSGDDEHAAIVWQNLWFLLCTRDAPVDGGLTFVQCAGHDPGALLHIMGYGERPMRSLTGDHPDDPLLADALCWFVRSFLSRNGGEDA